MEPANDSDIAALVDHEKGLVQPQIFADREIYKRELEQLFGRSWLYIAHDSQVKEAGDFSSARMGEESVIVCRSESGKLSAFLNVCPACASLLSRAEMGRTQRFTCAYHGWSFDLDGRLLIESPEEGVEPKPTDDLLLMGVPQLDSYKGCIFATFDETAPPLDVFLGDIRWGLDLFLDQANLTVASVLRWTVKANWKFAAESSVNDIYHGLVHMAALHADVSDGAEDRREREFNMDRTGFTIITEYGHGLNAEQAADGRPDENETLRRWRDDPAVQRRLGRFRMDVARSVITLFPNALFSSASRELHLWNPRGTEETEIWLVTFRDENEPADVQRAYRRQSQLLRGPAGLYSQDESENWEQATKGARSVTAGNTFFNYQMGLGRGEIIEDELSPPRIETLLNEHRQLWFYRNWANALAASSWEEWRKTHPMPRGTV